MSETIHTEQDPRQRVLGTVDGIVNFNPKLQGILPNGCHFTFSIGYCDRAGEAQTPRQVIVANIPSQEGIHRVAAVAVQAADRREDYRLWSIEPRYASDMLAQTPLEDEQVDDLQQLLADTEFGDEVLLHAFDAQYARFMTEAGPDARWWHGMLQEPVADLGS